jgi:ribosomal protein S10
MDGQRRRSAEFDSFTRIVHQCAIEIMQSHHDVAKKLISLRPRHPSSGGQWV